MVLTTIEARKMILRFASEIEESKFHLARNFERAFGLYFSVLKRRVLVPALLALLLPASGFAQGPQGNDFRRGRFSRLSMDEQASNEYRNKLREALLKADPSVQPILEKVRRHRHKDQRRQDR